MSAWCSSSVRGEDFRFDRQKRPFRAILLVLAKDLRPEGLSYNFSAGVG